MRNRGWSAEHWSLLQRTGAGLIFSTGLMLMDNFYLNLAGWVLAVITSVAFLVSRTNRGY